MLKFFAKVYAFNHVVANYKMYSSDWTKPSLPGQFNWLHFFIICCYNTLVSKFNYLTLGHLLANANPICIHWGVVGVTTLIDSPHFDKHITGILQILECILWVNSLIFWVINAYVYDTDEMPVAVSVVTQLCNIFVQHPCVVSSVFSQTT